MGMSYGEVNNSDIVYHYLKFDTLLPTLRGGHVSYYGSGKGNSSEPAGPRLAPDLTRCTDPQQWPRSRKTIMLILCCVGAMSPAFAAGAYSPPADKIAELFGTSSTLVLLGITMFTIGFALAPMVLAPFSELIGRYPVFTAAGVLFVIMQAVNGTVDSLAGILIVRLFVGIGGSVFSAMVGGVIADLWNSEERNTPMALFSGASLVATGLGPLVASVITFRTTGEGWRWVFYVQAIMNGVMMVALIVFFHESRGSVVLSRRAKALNAWYEQREAAGFFGVWMQQSVSTPVRAANTGDDEKIVESGPSSSAASHDGTTTLDSSELRYERIRWRVTADEQRTSLAKMISISCVRPFHMLFTESVVFWFSCWMSFGWAVLYLSFGSIFYIFETVYGWNLEQSGYVFGAMMAGAATATPIGIWSDRVLKNPRWRADCVSDQSSGTDKIFTFLRRRFPVESPESRLYFPAIMAILMPVGLFIFGCAAHPNIHWLVPALGIFLSTMGIFSVYLAAFNYLADIYGIYASSALAVQSCCRNLLGGVFPLVTIPMFQRLGNNGAGALLGGLGLALTLVPWVLIFFGEKIRSRSKFALSLKSDKT